MNLLHIISLIVVVLLTVALACRKRRNIHIPLMSLAMAIDITVVAYIEINRAVINRTINQPETLTPILTVHIILSVLTLLLYFAQIVFGILLNKNRESVRSWHRIAGWSLYIFRVGNFATSLLIF